MYKYSIMILSIIAIIALGIIAILGYLYFSNIDDREDKTESSKYLDQISNISFDYPASYRVVDDLVSKENEGVYVKSIQFSTRKEKVDLLPMQVTIFAQIGDDSKFQAQIDEVKKYYSDNGKEVSKISIDSKEIPLYHAEIKNDNTYIIGFFLQTDNFLFLIERYHSGSKNDDLADQLAEKIVATFDY